MVAKNGLAGSSDVPLYSGQFPGWTHPRHVLSVIKNRYSNCRMTVDSRSIVKRHAGCCRTMQGGGGGTKEMINPV